MNAIQAVLLAAALIWLIRYLARARVTGLSRLLGLAAVIGAMTIVLFPQWTSILAHALGVGRGVDLVIYLSLAGIGFLWLHAAARLKEIETRLTDLARHVSLAETRIETGQTPVPHLPGITSENPAPGRPRDGS